MSLRRASWLLTAPALLLLAGLICWSWLLHSESGARWLFSRLESSIPGSIGSSTIEGDLGSGLRLDGFHFDDGGTRVDVGRLTVAVEIDLLPPAIGLETLQADSVAIRVIQAPAQETDRESAIAGLSLPVPLRFGDVRISGLEYFDLSGDSVIFVHSIMAAGSLHRELVLDNLSVSLPDAEHSLSGRLGLSAPHPLSLNFQSSGEFALQGRVDGSLVSASLVLESNAPDLSVSGTVGDLLESPEWELDISSPRVRWPLSDPEPDAQLSELDAHSSGKWPQFELDLAGSLELRGLEPSRLELTGDGSSDGFTAHRLSMTGPELALEATGTISWKDGVHVLLSAVLERLDPGKWLEDWPENQAVNGELAVEWGGDELNVSSFSLAMVNAALSAQGHAIIDLRSGIVDADLSWNDLSWPPGSPAPQISSKNGHFLINGQPDDWKLDGELVVQAGQFPEGRVRMSGQGDLESLEVTVHEGTILGGTISGDIDWNWTLSQPFNARLAINGVVITPLAPRFPGMLNARLTASGELVPFRLGVELQHLDGTIQAQPVRASGGFHFEQNRMYADALNLQSGESVLLLNGALYERDGIDFSASIDSLARFSTDISGSITASGNVSLNPESPRFSASLSGQQLAFGPVEIASIETRERAGPGLESGREVVFNGLVIGQRPIDTLSLHFDGEQPLQGIAVNALVEGTQIDLGLNGSVNDWAAPLDSGWSGALSTLRFDHKGQFTLALDEAAALQLSPSHFSLEPVCLNGSRDARMCLESSWSSPDELNLSADLAAIPLGLLELFTNTDVRFTQVLSGTLNWSQAAGGVRDGGARVELSPGAIKEMDNDDVLLETGPGLFGFELGGGQLRQGNLDISFPGSGEIDLDFSVLDISRGRDSPVQGTARIDLSDIGAVGKIFDFFDTIDGVLDVDLSLSGALSNPVFEGSAALLNGLLENRASGFSFSEINLSGEVNKFDQAELEGSFRAGEGTGTVSTSIHFENALAPVVNLALEGEALTIVDVPDLKVIANPDMTLSWGNKTLEINGRLFVPAARLSPSILPQSSVGQSEDVVIVAGELPVVEEDFLQSKAIKFRGDFEVEMGDEVVIDLDLAQVSVTGATRFSWEDDLIPIANGNFDISGDIQAYGQFLRVTRGRISFPGIPADNPHLNIRAEREIFGNSQIRRAGLMVAGTLRRPVIEAYTVPMTNKHRAQTLLVTGSDFNYEQGVGAVDVGMYVLPRLYVSYGIGIFEEGNVIKARFDLGRGFGIRATSGQRETGLDISYTIER